MTNQTDVHLTPNGYGAQIYLKQALLQDSRCQLEAGDDTTARLTPDGGILIEPARTTDV